MEPDPDRQSLTEDSEQYADSDDYSEEDSFDDSNYDPEEELTQDFFLVAPSLRKKLYWEERGVLGTVLFDGSASRLAYHFARPLFPLSLEPEEGYCAPFKLNNIPTADAPSIREDLSQAPRKRPLSVSQAEETTSGPAKRQCSTLHLTTLPPEIQCHILSFLDLGEVLTLGLTCKALWNVAKFQITLHFPQYLGVWAGVPVICVGSWDAHSTDSYPPVLSEKDKEELQNGLDPNELSYMFTDQEKDPEPVNLNKLARYRYSSIWDVNYSFPPVLSTLASDLYQKYRYPKDIFRITAPKPSSFFPADRKWILRDLTTHEFVRSDAIALKPEYVSGPFIRGIGFGEVILARTCWSTNSDVAFDCNVQIHQGAWAGHMLDIVSAETISSDIGTWKDISGEVAEEIAEIWKSKYGDDWRNEVIASVEK